MKHLLIIIYSLAVLFLVVYSIGNSLDFGTTGNYIFGGMLGLLIVIMTVALSSLGSIFNNNTPPTSHYDGHGFYDDVFKVEEKNSRGF